MSLPKFITKPNSDIYLNGSYLVFDFETTNINKGDARNVDNNVVYYAMYSSISSRCEGYTVSSKASLYPLLDAINNHSFIVCHNTKFELKWLQRLGAEIQKVLPYCTLLGEYVIAGNRNWKLDLDSISKNYGFEGKESLVSKMIKSGVCPSQIPKSLLAEYCKQDVMLTLKVFLKQRKKLKDMGLLNVAYIRNVTTPMLADVEMSGMYLDEELVFCLDEKIRKQYQEVIAKLPNINWDSPYEKADLIYKTLGFEELKDRKGNFLRNKPNKRYPEGMPITNKDTLLELKATTKAQKEFIRLVIEESRLGQQISGYLNRFVDACIHQNCTLYGTINQSIAGSHRTTSSNPNLQNIDRTLKKVITARKKGWKILSGDYKQLEFRAAALLAKDKVAYNDIYVEKVDVHQRTSDQLTASNQPTDRQDSKEHTFKPLYGGTSGTKAERAYYDWFKARYTGIDAMHNEWISEVLSTGKLRTVTGLIFYWPDARIERSGYIKHNEPIRNYPVQMFATADIAPIGTLLLWHRLKDGGYESFIINLVHDSVILEVKDEEIKEVGNLLEVALSKDIRWFFNELIGYDIDYPLEVETKCKTNWDYNKND